MSEAQFLTLAIWVHGGRFHGMDHEADEWPPSPARVFQALVAAAGRGRSIPKPDREALHWLEALAPPVIGAPHMVCGQRVDVFVPNNDLDAKDGDPDRVSEIRVAKGFSPKLFDETVPFLYSWQIDRSSFAQDVVRIAHRLYQLGRGIDQAWALPTIDDEASHRRRLGQYRGIVYEPTPGTGASTPARGSLASLEARHAASERRFAGPAHAQQFSQAPKPRFGQVCYTGRVERFVFDVLREDGSFAVTPLDRAPWLISLVRRLASERLVAEMPEDRRAVVDSLGGATDPRSVRILALPSIGHEHADRGLRRIVVDVPPHEIPAEAIRWAFSGLELYEPETGVVLGMSLVPSTDETMLEHFGFGAAHRRWRTVIATDLSDRAKRRRIEPGRIREEAKPGHERVGEENRAVEGVSEALRQLGVWTPIERIRVQREPLARKGTRAESFATPEHVKEQLWHVDVTFADPVRGPLVVGAGRAVGLGLMAPVRSPTGVFAFVVESGLESGAVPEQIAHALRRAVLARVQAVIGRDRLSAYISGHNYDGSPSKRPHIRFYFDPISRRLFVIAPRVEWNDRLVFPSNDLANLETALTGFDDLRAGANGRLRLRSTAVEIEIDPLFAPSTIWISATPYQVTRHGRAGAVDNIRADVFLECERERRPRPVDVQVRNARGVPGVGLVGQVRLRFAVPVSGPLTLGRSKFLGGGLFVGRR